MIHSNEVVDYKRLNNMMADEQYVKEFANYITFDGMSKPKAFCKVFGLDYPLTDSLTVKLYRWVKKDEVHEWLEKANSSLQVDWIDKRVNALQHLYNLGTDEDNPTKIQVEALDKFLAHLNKEENKIRLDLGNSQVNIVQVVQDKLSSITSGATISPTGEISGVIDAEVISYGKED